VLDVVYEFRECSAAACYAGSVRPALREEVEEIFMSSSHPFTLLDMLASIIFYYMIITLLHVCIHV